MKDILEEIVENKRRELEVFRSEVSPQLLHSQVEALIPTPQPSMRDSLLSSNTGIIAEFKRKSPSKGWIKEEGRADIIPLSYQQNGASAISILTDTKYFGGENEFIRVARNSGLTLPVLYKNFVIDEYQLYQARFYGASAVLLIAACLSKTEYRHLLNKAHELGLEVLLEMHSEKELEYADEMPDMCGINNRNLGTFITSVDNSFRLAELLPSDACKVSESGISNYKVITELKQAGFNGFLIGECFMKESNPGQALGDFIKALNNQ